MTITNGYATLDQLKARLLELLAYTATTISFTASTDTITDTAKGLRAIQVGEIIEVEGSTLNNGFYTVATVVGPGSFTVSEALADEAAGASVTLRKAGDGFEDATLESVIEAVSRWIDTHTGRTFYASSSQTRYFTAESPVLVFVDDLLSVTSITLDSGGDRAYATTMSATDYDLMPANAATLGIPYRWIETSPVGQYDFPTHRKAVKITGTWGYSAAVDKRVTEACLLLSAKIFKRKDAPFGVTGSPDLGELRNIRPGDPDVATLLAGLDVGPLG